MTVRFLSWNGGRTSKERTEMTSLRTVSAMVLLTAAGVASGDVILGNLPGNGSGTGTNLGVGTDLADRTKGVGLTMGADAMIFQSLVALISNPDASARTLSGGIYASGGVNTPGALLASFDSVDVAGGTDTAMVSLTISGGFTLDANTSYWFILDGPTVSNGLLWESLSPNAAPVAASGMTFNGYIFSSNGGATWGTSTIYNGVQINAVVPAPAGLALIGLGGLAATRRRR